MFNVEMDDEYVEKLQQDISMASDFHQKRISLVLSFGLVFHSATTRDAEQLTGTKAGKYA